MNKPVVLVTGGAGFVGVPTVRLLVGRGFEVVVVDNFAVGSPSRLNALVAAGSVRIVTADLRDADTLLKAVEEARPWGVIHLAALHYIPYCVAHPAETVAVNILGLQHLLDALESADVQRLIFASTGDVYEPSERPHAEDDQARATSVYGVSKLTGESLIRLWRAQGGMTSPVVARLFNVYGPGETNPHVLPHLISSLREGDELRLGNTEARRDYTYVGDVAAALVALLSGELADVTVNIGTGRSWSVAELVDWLKELTGRELTIRVDPERLRRTDRPNLQADTTLLDRLAPGVVSTALGTGLHALLEAEGIPIR